MAKTANDVLAQVDEDHNYRLDPIDYKSTGGIQRALERNWNAIKALADHIDGRDRENIDQYGNPVDSRRTGAVTPPGPNGPDDFGTSAVERDTPATEATRVPPTH